MSVLPSSCGGADYKLTADETKRVIELKIPPVFKVLEIFID